MPFLDWINKNQAKQQSRDVPYHLLKHQQSFGDSDSARHNMLIQGDNLLALKALMPLYAGQVKCIFIDPPYNTQSAFEHYDDKLEHSQWLSMMYPRLVLLRDLLTEDGSIWITIDDNEVHYFKVLMDEVFGRRNFISNIVWQKKYAVKSDSEFLSESHDHILVFSKNKHKVKLNRLPRTEIQDSRYKNPDKDSRGPWTSGPLQRNEARDYAIYPIVAPNGKEHWPPKGTSWRYTKDKLDELIRDNRIWFGEKGNNVPRLKRFLTEVSETIPATTWWSYSESGHNDEARRESKLLQDSDDLFSTPKPEKLIHKILTLGTNQGDLILDSFLGSGTTAAVAHKMGRRYIGIEMGEHALTHCVPRLQKVVDGELGGISKAVNWQGGGGFSFYTLGETAFDEYGQINQNIRFSTLAAYVWSLETGAAAAHEFASAKLGNDTKGNDLFLLYNGILGDKKPQGGNVLTAAVLNSLRELQSEKRPMIVYGESCRIGPARLAAENITFKQIPYDIKMC